VAFTRSQVERFRDEGFIVGIPVFSAAECRRFRETAERFRAEHAADRDWAFDIKCNLLFDWVYANATDPRLLDVVADLLGEDLFLTDSVFRIKEPGSDTHYGWHQDSARIVVEPAPAIVYVAISEATVENGCLAVIPQSHDHVRPFDLVENPGQAHRRVARVREVDPRRAVYLELRAGEVAVFSANVIHGSAPNRSTAARFAILHDFTPAAAHQSVGRGSGQLVRGRDAFGHFAHEPVPSADFEANVRMRRRVLTEYPENILMGPLEPGARPDFPDRREAPVAGGSAR
jgi:ectoine hydroxylase-related dioxygenase (phytanoyl-CoA dioxygenase family)